jgi:hypothetical protein
MSTKYRIGEQIVKALGQRGVGVVTIQQAMLVASQIANKNIRDYIWALKSDGDITIPHSVLKEYTKGVVFDQTRDMWYVPLTVRTLDTLYGNMGVYSVYPKGRPADHIVPLSATFLGMYSGLGAYSLEGMLGYMPERDRIYLTGDTWTSDSEVSMLLIPDCTSLDPDDQMPGFVEMEADVLAQAIQILAPQLQTQNIENDNTKK